MVANKREPALSGYLAVVDCEPCSDGSYAWVAQYPDLPGCMAHGEKPEEALVNLAEAADLYLRDLADRGIAAPEPGSSARAKAILEAMRQ